MTVTKMTAIRSKKNTRYQTPWMTLFIIIALFVAVGFIISWAMRRQGKETLQEFILPKQNADLPEQNVITPKQRSEQDIISERALDEEKLSEDGEWKIYRNYTFGFEVSYPKEWYAEAPAYGGSIGGPYQTGPEKHILGIAPEKPVGDWLFLVNISALTKEELIHSPDYRWNQFGKKVTSSKSVNFGVLQGERIEWSNESVMYLFEHPVHSWTLTFEGPGDEESSASLEIIVSSFRFF